MRHFSLIAVFMTVLLVSVSFSQDALPTGVAPNGYIQPPPVKVTPNPNYVEQGSLVNKQINQEPVQTDEYGEFSDNAVLTGIGSNADFVLVPDSPDFDEDFDGSIEMWVNVNITPVNMLISKGIGAGRSFYLLTQGATGQLQFRIGNTFFVSTSNVPNNTWTHVAVVWTGGPTNFTVQFYINGTAAGTVGPSAATYGLNADPLRIGANTEFTSWTNGQLDEVRFWNSARTAAQIRDNRFAGVGDGSGANTGGALNGLGTYNGLDASWTFGNASTAYDDIGGHNGSYVSCNAVNVLGGQPIPYNFALLSFGGANDYVTVPTSGSFNQTSAGSIDAWINLSVATGLQTIVSKGTSFANHSFAFYVSSGKLGLNIGAHNYISTGVTFAANQWYHVAATWSGGPNFTVTLYVNGVQDYTSTFNLAMPTNADPLTIGKYYSASGYMNGYIDELRIWGNALNINQIKGYMFNSGRSGTMAGLVAHWNFDGNLLNFGSGTGIGGSFNAGTSRMSAYSNETNSGAISTAFISHNSVLNRDIAPNPFIGGFAMNTPFLAIPAIGTVSSTIIIPGGGTVTSVELFMSINHTFTDDLDITLTSPNGQVRDITSDNGGSSDNGYLCFFVDAAPTLVTDPNFLAPFSNLVRPEILMGNMGGSVTNGTWTLTITDDLGGDSGVLKGWGIRLNGSLTAIEPVSNNIPIKFNLYQNYPNPFNPVSNIKFDIAKNSNVKLVVYDLLGREVKTLVNEFTQAGQYEVKFDGSNLASGTYFFKIEAGDFTDVKKMILVK